jgi:hypothetical protein
MAARKRITREDVLPMDVYAQERRARRAGITEIKKNRRIEVGPFATFYFENYETMWHQVHEMLNIEKGGEEQIAAELAAYNPLIPQGSELVATVMFEIDDPIRRQNALARLGGVEGNFRISVAGETIRGIPEAERENTRPSDNKASAVQFVHFPFTAAQKSAFLEPGVQVLVGIDHPNYGHLAVMPEPVRRSLAEDFD